MSPGESLQVKGSSPSLGGKNHKNNRRPSESSRGRGGNNHNNYSRGRGRGRGGGNPNNYRGCGTNYIRGNGGGRNHTNVISGNGGGNHHDSVSCNPNSRGGRGYYDNRSRGGDRNSGNNGKHNGGKKDSLTANKKKQEETNHGNTTQGGDGGGGRNHGGRGKHNGGKKDSLTANKKKREETNHGNTTQGGDGGGGRNHGSQSNNGKHNGGQKDSTNANKKKHQTNHENTTQGGDESSKTEKENKHQTKLDELEDELSKIIGLEELKSQLRTFAKGMLMDEMRRAMGVELGPRKSPHMVFLGNPGTGKTTVARILGKLLHSVGVLSEDKMTEVQRSDLVGQYLGQTAQKTKEKIEEAKGGVLFVDEAYRLAIQNSSGSWADYGVEALEEIMSVLEDGNIVVIFAGYSEPMKRVFSTNEGFTRRVTNFFQFDDFSCHDLAKMLMIKMTKQNNKSRLYGFKLHPSCTVKAVRELIERNSTKKLRSKLNGGLVDHMLNNARQNLDSRLSFDSKGDDLLTITMNDLEAGVRVLTERIKVE